MDTTTLRGEETLQALTERLYGRLKGEQQQRAEMVLLEANPGLEAIGGLANGSLLVVPTIPGFTVTPDVKLEDPLDQMMRQIRADLEAYRKELREALEEERQETDSQLKLVGAEYLQGLIGDDRNLNEVVDSLRSNLDQRRRELKRRDDNLDVDPLG